MRVSNPKKTGLLKASWVCNGEVSCGLGSSHPQANPLTCSRKQYNHKPHQGSSQEWRTPPCSCAAIRKTKFALAYLSSKSRRFIKARQIVFLLHSMQVCGSHPASCIVHLPELLWSILHALHGNSAVKEETYWSILYIYIYAQELRPSSFCKITHLCASSTTRYMSLWTWGQRHLETRHYGTLCHYCITSQRATSRNTVVWVLDTPDEKGLVKAGGVIWEAQPGSKALAIHLVTASDIRPEPLSPPQPTLVCITFVCTLQSQGNSTWQNHAHIHDIQHQVSWMLVVFFGGGRGTYM